MKATIKQISELSGVSIGTVDRVLHDRPGVSEKTKQKVLQISRELGYESNIIGRALVNQKKPMIIGVVILAEQTSFFSTLLKKGIDQAAKQFEQFGFMMKYYFMNTIDAEEALALIEEAQRDELSGLIIRPIQDERIKAAINRLADRGVPVVTCSWDIEDSGRMCFVGQNHVKEGRIAANLLDRLSSGTGKVGVIGSTYGVSAQQQKIAGLNQYIQEKAIDMETVKMIETYNVGGIAYEQTLFLLRAHPEITALCIQTSRVEEVCKAVIDLGRAQTLHIIVYGNAQRYSKLLQENVIDFVIEEDPVLNGTKTVQLLFDYLFYNRKPAEPMIIIDSTIKVAESEG